MHIDQVYNKLKITTSSVEFSSFGKQTFKLQDNSTIKTVVNWLSLNDYDRNHKKFNAWALIFELHAIKLQFLSSNSNQNYDCLTRALFGPVDKHAPF